MYKLSLFLWFVFSVSFQNIYCQGSVLENINLVDSSGLKQGYWLDYYSSGIVKSIGYYVKGELDGSYFSFHNNGTIESIIEFDYGIHDGAYRLFYANGKRKSLIISSKQKREYSALYDKEGNISYEEIFENGVLIVTKHYTDDGVIEGLPIPPPSTSPNDN